MQLQIYVEDRKMVTSSDFISVFSILVRGSRHEGDRIAGHLRKARFIPVGPRGVYAPHLRPQNASNLFIALMASKRPKDAVEAVNTYSKMKPNYEQSNFNYNFDGNTFGEVFDEIFAEPDLAYKIENLELCRTWPEANLCFKFGEKISTLNFSSEIPDEQKPLMRELVIIDGGIIHELSIKVNSSPGIL
jgi:hypothetical protein